MIKNGVKVLLIFVLITNICGCAELRRKFVRKKKSRKEEYTFYHPQEYKPKPPHESYQEHYVLWHNWHLDLERRDGTSHSRYVNSTSEALRHLTAMRDLLEEEKAKELQKQIEDMEAVLKKIRARRIDVAKDVRTSKVIARIERIIMNNFSYNRMKDYIRGNGE